MSVSEAVSGSQTTRGSQHDPQTRYAFVDRGATVCMTSEPCDICQTNVRIAGGIGDLWNFSFESTQGMTLELTDGSEHFLCFECVERLPADHEPTAEDVARLDSSVEVDTVQEESSWWPL